MTEPVRGRQARSLDLRICAWGGPLACLFFVMALLVLMRFVPPLPPSLGATEVAALYRDNSIGIRLGAVSMVLATTLLLPWSAAISKVLDLADRPLTAFAKAQLISSVLAFGPLMYASFFFAAASFRPDRGDDLVLLLSDAAWIFLVMTPGLIQPLAIGLAILMDDSREPLFPRWLGYLNLFFSLLFSGGVLNPMFKTGPFAWNGLVAFWIPAGIFSGWVIAMTVGLLAAARKLERRNAQGMDVC